ncbi:hypothetical protein TRIUR3_12312 [Triticum urartu]|uniref:Uncharacterized protein n=1 Tax=Triticum urartu TaxID=4572 RepID=M7ZZ45_TRIUA|nr:hypothetical protein TRIUR3_12312 [Triticum urartu]
MASASPGESGCGCGSKLLQGVRLLGKQLDLEIKGGTVLVAQHTHDELNIIEGELAPLRLEERGGGVKPLLGQGRRLEPHKDIRRRVRHIDCGTLEGGLRPLGGRVGDRKLGIVQIVLDQQDGPDEITACPVEVACGLFFTKASEVAHHEAAESERRIREVAPEEGDGEALRRSHHRHHAIVLSELIHYLAILLDQEGADITELNVC